MKNHFVSAVAGWKSAALLALVAMLAAVAFSGVLTGAHSTDAQAPVIWGTDSDGNAPTIDGSVSDNAVPGQTGIIRNGGAIVRFEVTPQHTTASGRFVHPSATNNGQTLICSDHSLDGGVVTLATCDRSSVEAIIDVLFAIDADSPLGFIYITESRLADIDSGQARARPNPDVSFTILTVGQAAAPTGTSRMTVAVSELSSPLVDIRVEDGQASIDVRVSNFDANGAETTQVDATVLVETTLGSITNCSEGAITGRRCSVFVQRGLVEDVFIRHGGLTGVATVTVTHPTLGSKSVDLTFYGAPANVEVTPMQATMEPTSLPRDNEHSQVNYLLVTVTDAQGNPVPGVNGTMDNASVPPLKRGMTTAPDGTPIQLDIVGDRDLLPTAATGPYPNGLPACNDYAGRDRAYDADGNYLGENPDNPMLVTYTMRADDHAPGTDAQGRCVYRVIAKAETPAPQIEGVALGAHTVTVQLGAGINAPVVDSATATIVVTGPPANINVSPASGSSVAGLSDTTVTFSVTDASGNSISVGSVTVVKVAGSGIINQGASARVELPLVNGQGSFTYTAGTAPDTAIFRFSSASSADPTAMVTELYSLNVGDDMMASAGWSDSIRAGWQNVVWEGADGASVSANIPAGVTAVWFWNGAGWDAYFPAAAAGVPNANTLSTLENGGAYWVISN